MSRCQYVYGPRSLLGPINLLSNACRGIPDPILPYGLLYRYSTLSFPTDLLYIARMSADYSKYLTHHRS